MWMRGEDTDDADVAAILTAETMLMLNVYLGAKLKKG